MRHAVLGLLLVLTTSITFAQTVTQRVRVGHSIEDLDHIGDHLVVIDGYEIFAAPPLKSASAAAPWRTDRARRPSDERRGFRKLMDIRDAGVSAHVNAFTWIESEQLFAFIQTTDRTRMILSGIDGSPKGTRPITYPPGFFPTGTEGITWLPEGTPFADHIALVAFDDQEASRIEIMTRAGKVVNEIILPAPFDTNLIGSVEALGADRLVVVVLSIPTELYVIDYTGAVVSGPIKVFEASGCEGVARAGDGFVIADYSSGRFFALDDTLERRPECDLHNDFGVKLDPDGIAWDSNLDRYIMTSFDQGARAGFTVPVSLDDAMVAFHPAAHGLAFSRHVAYMPDERKTVLAHRQNPTAILVYSERGELLEQIDISSLGSSLNSLVYEPTAKEFYLRFSETALRLRVVSRNGTPLRDVDLSGTAATGFGPMTLVDGNLLILTNLGLVRTDLNGLPLATYSTGPLRVPRLAGLTAITTGPDAGKFAACDSSGGEVIVFTLP